jgi:hypothetical protein
MGNRDRVLSFLRTEAKSFCDDCLSEVLNVRPRQQVNQITRALASHRDIQRVRGVCSRCGDPKLVNRSPSTGAAREPVPSAPNARRRRATAERAPARFSQSSHAQKRSEVTVGNPQDDDWLGRKWAPWVSLQVALARGRGALRQPGLYRLRDSKSSGLLYVGEGGDVRGRLFQLRNAMQKVAAGGKQGPPHWAGACVLHHQRHGANVEVSWLLEAVADEGERKGLECEYIAAHRWATGGNPDCQFTALARRETQMV